ncbi:MAG TPA: PepSY-associated TM helix domain-containing protein [Xanthobacteraceae bacterium]|nr:PepSY-associated TM helix domain-containing protein [Xanthobacteraceae bacterium]
MTANRDANRRSFWLKQLHQWHWVSSALCLVGMLLFAATGITLNHAGQIEASPRVTTLNETLPADLTSLVQPEGTASGPLPAAIRAWILDRMSVRIGEQAAEWSSDEVYVALPRPGGDAWLTVDRGDGAIIYELTDRGWIAWLNDLHKGRHAGLAWSLFIDIFAVACVVFCLTGFVLLQFHAAKRPATWPMVGLGVVIPLLLIILLIH